MLNLFMLDYIDIFTIVLAVAAVTKLTADLRSGRFSFKRYFVWMVFWVLLVVLVFYPGISDRIAVVVGIDRGTDAAFFGAILLLFYGVFRVVLRLEQIERNITKLVREISLRGGEDNSKN